MHARISILEGESTPTEVELTPNQPITIGRSRDNNVVLPQCGKASRLHARIYWEADQWKLRDFGLNGTKINDVRINQSGILEDGCEIRIGDNRFRFSISQGATLPIQNRTTTTLSLKADAEVEKAVTLSQSDLQGIFETIAQTNEASNVYEAARVVLQNLFYRCNASQVFWCNLDVANPIDKLCWPENATFDLALARSTHRRLVRDQKTYCLSSEPVNPDGKTLTVMVPNKISDLIAIPLKRQDRHLGALHIQKKLEFFSDRECLIAEAYAGHLATIIERIQLHSGNTSANSMAKKARDHLFGALLGDSQKMVLLRREIKYCASANKPLLFVGSPWTGHFEAAWEAHSKSPRAKGPFIVAQSDDQANPLKLHQFLGYRRGAFVGATNEMNGFYAQADDGTLLIDEIALLPLDCQADLVRFIETATFQPLGMTYAVKSDVRIIATTSYNLETEVAAGRFNPELLRLIGEYQLHLPTLNEHTSDIAYLAQSYLDQLNVDYRRHWHLSPGAIEWLQQQQWPGQIRQLHLTLELVAINCKDNFLEAQHFERLATR